MIVSNVTFSDVGYTCLKKVIDSDELDNYQPSSYNTGDLFSAQLHRKTTN